MTPIPIATPAVRTWFAAWLDFHQLVFRHLDWLGLDEAGGEDFYDAWILELARANATYETAIAASQTMQRRADLQTSVAKHLPALGEMVRCAASARSCSGARASPAMAEARSESVDCPECKGTGYARRRTVYREQRWHISVTLYCRCSLGRYLLDHAQDDRDRGERFDDLQAMPELWNPALSHRTWSDRPARRTRQPFETGVAECRYLVPEPPPAPAPEKKIGRRVASQATPTADRNQEPATPSNATMNRSSRQC